MSAADLCDERWWVQQQQQILLSLAPPPPPPPSQYPVPSGGAREPPSILVPAVCPSPPLYKAATTTEELEAISHGSNQVHPVTIGNRDYFVHRWPILKSFQPACVMWCYFGSPWIRPDMFTSFLLGTNKQTLAHRHTPSLSLSASHFASGFPAP